MSPSAFNTSDRRVLREACTEAVVVLALDVGLLAGLAVVDEAKARSIIDLRWWAWLLLAARGDPRGRAVNVQDRRSADADADGHAVA